MMRWAVVLGVFLAVLLVGAPAGVSPAAWRLFAVFIGTIAGLIAQPAPGGLVVLLGVLALVILGTMPVETALAGYADPWSGWFGAGYVSQRDWWRLGLLCAVPHLLVWGVVGPHWWRVLGWW